MIRIIEYENKYLEDVKDLLVELEEYIVSIDKDNLDRVHEEYREKNICRSEYHSGRFISSLTNLTFSLEVGFLKLIFTTFFTVKCCKCNSFLI